MQNIQSFIVYYPFTLPSLCVILVSVHSLMLSNPPLPREPTIPVMQWQYLPPQKFAAAARFVHGAFAAAVV